MKKTLLLLIASTIVLASAPKAKAQVPIIEKRHEVSHKAKNGYLGGIEMHPETETFDMVYILPSLLPRKVKYEIYTYDKELNLLSTVKEEEWLEKVKLKWRWFTYKGDIYVGQQLTASATAFGKVVFKKKEITYTYDWWIGDYRKKVKQLEVVKPKTDTDAKYDYKASYEVAADSSVILVAGLPEKKTWNTYKKFEIMSCDNQININTLEKFEFEFPQQAIYSAPLTDENEGISNDAEPRDWILIFAPMKAYKGAQDLKPTNFTFMRISPKGKIKERFTFDSPTNGWRIITAYEKDGSVFLVGPSIHKDKKYFGEMGMAASVPTTSASYEEKLLAQAQPAGVFGSFAAIGTAEYGVTQEEINVGLDELKYTNFQIGKITNGKVDFMNAPTIKDFAEKQAKPIDQKKFVVFDGKKFIISNISFDDDGSIFVSGQDFAVNDGVRLYKGIYMFQFEKDGTLKKNYGVLVDQKKKKGLFSDGLSSDMYLATNYIQKSSDGKKLYWLLRSAKTIAKQKDNQYPLYGIDYGSINIETGELSEFKELGEDEKRDYFLFPNTAGYNMKNYMYFFNESKNGASILLSRMDLSK